MRVDSSRFQPWAQPCRAEEIVYAPANIAVACLAHLTPPSVVAARFLECAESIDKAGLDKCFEAGALFRSEAVVFHVVARRRAKVQLGMGDIQVSAPEDGLGAFEGTKVGQEVAIPLPPVGQARWSVPVLSLAHRH